MKNYKVLILGAGASACMCALISKEKNIAMIDASSKPAKKLLVTGNGRCNLSHFGMNSNQFNTNIDKYLGKFGVFDTLEFFSSLGLEWYKDDECRVYPYSNSAKSVQDVILNSLKNKIDFYGEEKIEKVWQNCGKYNVKTDKDEYVCEKLVIGLGGNSGFVLDNLNIKYKQFIPSLVSLKTNNTKDLSGIRLSDVRVTAINAKGKSIVRDGEVLFKDSGLSGIVIFDVSTIFARSGEFKGKVSIDIMRRIPYDSLVKKLEARKKNNVGKLDKFFVGMFQNAVANEIFRQSKINTNTNASKLTKNDIEQLAETIKSLEFEVKGVYDNNQVYSGGISLLDLTDNLEHKNYKNLYFMGEICDVDGECGGYNLQWAWTSGKIVGDCL